MSCGYEIRKYPNWDFPVMPIFELCVRSELSHLESVRFIQVGGNDGIQVDPIHDFYKHDERWIGHIFEPNPEIFPSLKNNLREIQSRISAHEVAMSNFAGESELYVQNSDNRKDSSVISSMKRKTFLKQKKIGAKFKTVTVPTQTLDQFLSDIAWTDFELLQIDTEGHEVEIIDGLDLTAIKPRVIQIEIGHLSRRQINKLTRKLGTNGYSIYWGGHQADMVGILL